MLSTEREKATLPCGETIQVTTAGATVNKAYLAGIAERRRTG